jgi:hypothetical protein
MATGSYDANGIWNYGEDDNIALFSDTLNMLAESTSDAFTDDRNRLSTLEAGSLAGLVPVSVNTVTVATGSAAVNDLGTISFTGVTSITLDGAFTSAYENYKILFECIPTASGSINSQFRSAGSTIITPNYAWGNVGISTGVSTLDSATNASSMRLHPQTLTSATSSMTFDVISPVSAGTRTQIYGQTSRSRDTFQFTAGSQVNGAIDGMTLVHTAGNITGKLTVYGYNQ